MSNDTIGGAPMDPALERGVIFYYTRKRNGVREVKGVKWK